LDVAPRGLARVRAYERGALKPSRANADVVNVEAMAILLIIAGLVSVVVLLVLIASYEENGAERHRASLVAQRADPELAVLDFDVAAGGLELDADVVSASGGEDFAGAPESLSGYQFLASATDLNPRLTR